MKGNLIVLEGKNRESKAQRDLEFLKQVLREIDKAGCKTGNPNLTAKLVVSILTLLQSAKNEALKG